MQNKKTRLAVLLAAILALLGALGWNLYREQKAKAAAPQYSWLAWDVFDTITNVVGNAPSEEEWNRQMEALHTDLLEYHQLYDIYNTYEGMNNLATVNAMAGQGPVEVDVRILRLLEMAKNVHQLTEGKMNPAAGAVLELWHEARTYGLEKPEQAYLPDENALQEAARHCDMDGVIIDYGAGTVELLDPDMSLDVGSLGKGYAVEMCARAAEERGLTSASISVGGNIRTIGSRRDGSPWRIGLESPWVKDGAGNLLRLGLRDGKSLVTSGDYQRYYTVDEVQYAHIIDMDTLYPPVYYREVSVLAQDSGMADCLSTALFCMDWEAGSSLVESMADVEACWVMPDQSIRFSTGFEEYVEK